MGLESKIMIVVDEASEEKKPNNKLIEFPTRIRGEDYFEGPGAPIEDFNSREVIGHTSKTSAKLMEYALECVAEDQEKLSIMPYEELFERLGEAANFLDKVISVRPSDNIIDFGLAVITSGISELLIKIGFGRAADAMKDGKGFLEALYGKGIIESDFLESNGTVSVIARSTQGDTIETARLRSYFSRSVPFVKADNKAPHIGYLLTRAYEYAGLPAYFLTFNTVKRPSFGEKYFYLDPRIIKLVYMGAKAKASLMVNHQKIKKYLLGPEMPEAEYRAYVDNLPIDPDKVLTFINHISGIYEHYDAPEESVRENLIALLFKWSCKKPAIWGIHPDSFKERLDSITNEVERIENEGWAKRASEGFVRKFEKPYFDALGEFGECVYGLDKRGNYDPNKVQLFVIDPRHLENPELHRILGTECPSEILSIIPTTHEQFITITGEMAKLQQPGQDGSKPQILGISVWADFRNERSREIYKEIIMAGHAKDYAPNLEPTDVFGRGKEWGFHKSHEGQFLVDRFVKPFGQAIPEQSGIYVPDLDTVLKDTTNSYTF
ncbi:hypothetical protein ACFL9U_14035 [Thermodesulfobacteriota bacterium]